MKASPAARPKKPLPELFTANQIATELGRSPGSVIEKIKALKIHPQSRAGSWKLYPPAVLEQLRGAMRAPNRKAAATSSTGI